MKEYTEKQLGISFSDYIPPIQAIYVTDSSFGGKMASAMFGVVTIFSTVAETEWGAVKALLKALIPFLSYDGMRKEIDELRALTRGDVVDECPTCGGIGDTYRSDGEEETCKTCGGSGFVRWILSPIPINDSDERINDEDIPF